MVIYQKKWNEATSARENIEKISNDVSQKINDTVDTVKTGAKDAYENVKSWLFG